MKHPLPPEFSRDPIRIAVAGAGGNGSQILSGLARMQLALRALDHPGLEVAVFDPDIVTEANVGRQLFSPSDVGCYKAEVLVNRINCYFGLAWEAYPVKYAPNSKSVNILIGCVDSAAARRELVRTSFDYWLDLGNQEKKGQVILGQKFEYDFKAKLRGGAHYQDYDEDEHGRTAVDPVVKKANARDQALARRLPNVMEYFYELMDPNIKEDDAPSCSLVEALGRQDLFINQTVATFALQLLWQFIRQGGLDIQGYFINLETGHARPLPIDYLRPLPAPAKDDD